MINPGLRDRTVLVTGANNPFGIGAAIARAFARLGTNIFLHYYRSPAAEAAGIEFYRAQQVKSFDEVLDQLRGLGTEAGACEADFTHLSSVPAIFDAAERACGPVEVLVNNAASWRADTFVPQRQAGRNPFLELWSDAAAPLSPESSVRQFAANACAPALLIREFADRHVERHATWGRIINISTAGSDCFPSEISYGASKYALESYTRSAAVELGQFGITVNALALGPVQTGWITPELERAVLPTIPLGRIGTPDDVADVVVFIASDQARWMTGQRLLVSGGHRV